MAVNDPAGQVQVLRTRFSLLDTNGVPSPGSHNSYVTTSLVSCQATPVYKTGEHIDVENGEGQSCVNFDGDDSLLRIDFTMVLCKPDPYLEALIVEGSTTISATGLPTTTGNPGDPADPARPFGWAMPSLGPITSRRLSIEFWTKRVDNGELKDVYPYAWWVMPETRRRKMGQTTLANGAVVRTITGQAYQNLNWFDGPSENWPAPSDRCLQWLPARFSEVPAASDQYQPVTAS